MSRAAGNANGKFPRRMARAELLGRHTHRTRDGVGVHVWERGGKFLARGSYAGRRFGVTLGDSVDAAESELRHLLVRFDNGTFQRPCEARKQILKTGVTPRCSLRELCNAFLAEKRRTRGRKTVEDYRSRLAPVIEFAELPEFRRRWPLAMDLDRTFAIELKSFLLRRKVSRNGRAAGAERPVSSRHVHNSLSTLRTMLEWARRPDVNQLPSSFANPVAPEIVGRIERKDPLREIKLPQERRIAMVREMDVWQLCHFAVPFLLPLRPDEYTGLLVSDVDFENRWLRFGTRLGGHDFNKGRQEFRVPFPDAIRRLLEHCVAGRAEGPLFLRRLIFARLQDTGVIAATAHGLEVEFGQIVGQLPADEVQAEQDYKRHFRRLLRKLGGASCDSFRREFHVLLERTGATAGIRLYDLRGSINSELEHAGVSHLVQRYVTGHTTRDILHDYVTLDPVAEMQKYFDRSRPLLEAIVNQAERLGLP